MVNTIQNASSKKNLPHCRLGLSPRNKAPNHDITRIVQAQLSIQRSTYDNSDELIIFVQN